MSRWFRFYDDAINDPKVLRLSDEVFRGWVALLCVASKSNGKLPPASDLEIYLRMKPARVAFLITSLVQAGLLDRVDDAYEPHNWGGRQYISDSTERVKRHRQKRAAAGLAPQWQPSKDLRKQVYAKNNHECVYCGSADDLTIDHKIPEFRGGTHDVSNLQTACRACNASKRDLTHDEFVTRNVTNVVTKQLHETHQSTETDSEPEKNKTRASALADGWPPDFREQFWALYPNKVGKPKAFAKLELCRKRGVVFADIVDGVVSYVASKPADRAWLNPETFINQERWLDQPAIVSNGRRTVHDAAKELSRNLAALDEPAPRLCEPAGGSPLRLLPSR